MVDKVYNEHVYSP